MGVCSLFVVVCYVNLLLHTGILVLHCPLSMQVTNSEPFSEYPGSQLKVTFVPTALLGSDMVGVRCSVVFNAAQGGLQAGRYGTHGDHWP